ncbi:dGTPase [Herbinix hemicellulosilytica]|uniref:Deoxyguanosinetriphosphate triphosphohydrolase-like protein n=1 Tax=Herbinix hemicellulosilytica TaxID=1564487 RepID=A0A0H5SES9_HERHM|nr:deoxyguanosinetriphosphate triphosphohydrolase [Herbinix hemicellulosilytica]RBP57806.1 dGTPase [Herbinix hemicellulosilytica]CRZ33361.1 Deoxyguanosinetriphosphate triphosphohydrolase-like protein [Herbinix hemicellulosilytica]
MDNNLTIRQKLELREHEILSPYAAFSDQSQGRDYEEEQCDIRPVYQRDRDRILHSKAFRRLKHKTQVFLAPEGDHYRTRLTHTLEVSQISRTIAKALRLNEDLTEAIALGHDLGHTPFGHAGERALNRVCPGGFKHYLQSIRVVELLENHGKGLNLTKEVRDGIRNHQMSTMPSTLEGKVVRLSDKIAYVHHDTDDAIRGGIIKEEDIPKEYKEILGDTLVKRLNTIINDIITNSDGKNDIIMSPEVEKALFGLREFLFSNVYLNKKAKSQEEQAERLVETLFLYYMDNPELLPQEYFSRIEKYNEPTYQVVCDYVAGMTDRYAVAKFKQLMIPSAWSVY